MSTTPPDATPPPPVQPRRRRWLVLLLLLVLVGATTGVGVWWRQRSRPAVPPPIPTEGVRPEVVAALTAAHKEVSENPRSAIAWGSLGLVFTAHGFDDQSAECFREAHRLDKDDARWPYMLGLYYQTDDRDPAAALSYLETALACSNQHRREGAIRLRLAEVYLANKRLPDAERLFREQLARDPTDQRALAGLGVTLLTADRPRDAIEFLQGATDSPFTRRRATTGLANASRLLGDAAGAARYEQQVAGSPEDLPPPDPFVADAAARRVDGKGGFDEVAALEKEGRIRDTIPLLTRMAEDPSNVRAAVLLGQNLSVLGQPAAAEPYLRAACARDPENVQAAVLLGTVLYDLAQAETANKERKAQLLRESAEASARAIKLNPTLGMAHFSRGMALQGLGDLPTALPHFRLAAECRPESPHFQLGLLQALIDSGLVDEARVRLPIAERVTPADHPRLIDIRKQLTKPAVPDKRPKP
jgi:tetratricopeptide (TPR) repeat protein